MYTSCNQNVYIFLILCYNVRMNYQDILKSDYFNKTYEEIEELKKDFYVNHGFIHINGVINNAKYLAELFCLTEKQKELLLIASALHDVGYLKGREDHAKNGGVIVREYLNGKMPEDDIDIVCNAIASHGGKTEDDYVCPVSMCLILADKFDFAKQRYKDDGKEHKHLPLFQSIEKIVLTKEDGNNFKLNIYTTNKKLFDNIEDNYFFQKLFEVLKRVKNVCDYNIELTPVDYKSNLKTLYHNHNIV